uniref:Uncharacterized protein n=1 Tax=Nothobranchius kuhntae TaxID=321403 RepID=A0A1A8KJL4_NOTKU
MKNSFFFTMIYFFFYMQSLFLSLSEG